MNTIIPGTGAPEQPTPHTIDRLIGTIKATVPADTITEANRLADTLETAYANLVDTLDRATHIAAQAEETARQITHRLATPADGILDILDDITGVGRLATALAALEHAATIEAGNTPDRVDLADLGNGDRVQIRGVDYSYTGRSNGHYVFAPVHKWQNGRPTDTLVLDADDCAHIVATRINYTNTTEAGR